MAAGRAGVGWQLIKVERFKLRIMVRCIIGIYLRVLVDNEHGGPFTLEEFLCPLHDLEDDLLQRRLFLEQIVHDLQQVLPTLTP